MIAILKGRFIKKVFSDDPIKEKGGGASSSRDERAAREERVASQPIINAARPVPPYSVRVPLTLRCLDSLVMA